MATELKQIIEINAAEGLRTLKELRDNITEYRGALAELGKRMDEYRKQMDEAEQGTEAYNKAQQELNRTQEDYEAVAKAVAKTQSEVNNVMNASKKYVEAEKGSMNDLLATLRQQKEAWKALGDGQKDARDALTEQIKETKAKINSLNEGIGNYQHNVGNYTNSIVDAFKQMGISVSGGGAKMASMFGLLQGGLGKLGAAFKGLWAAMAANPIGAVIAAVGALVGAFSGLKRAIENNEESQLRLHQAMSAFRPISDRFSRWLDQVGQGFVNLIELIADATNWLRKSYAAYLDWMEGTDEHSKKFEAEKRFYEALAKAENSLFVQRRQHSEANAKDKVTVEKLRDEAAATTDAKKRTELLTQAKEAQQRINERNVRQAKQELEVLEMQSKMTPNSIEMYDKLSQARVKVTEAEMEGYRAMRTLDSGITRATESTQKLTEAQKEQLLIQKKFDQEVADIVADEISRFIDAEEARRDKAFEINAKLEQDRLNALQKENLDYAYRKKLLEDYGYSTEALEEEHQRRLTELQYKAGTERLEREEELRQKKNSDEAEPSIWEIDERIAMYDADLEAYTAYIEAKIALNTELMETYAEDSEEFKKLDKENADLRISYMDAVAENGRKKAEDYKKLEKAKAAATKQFVSQASGMLKDLSSAMGESTRLGKGLAIASATIDTIASAVSGFRAGWNQWKDAGTPLAALAPIQAAANAAAALVAGYAQVQKIASVDTSGNASAGGGGGATALAMPNIEGLSSPVDYTRQVTTETEREEINNDQRVYILESDIQASNTRVKVREEETTF